MITREEWLRRAVEELDRQLFEGDLHLDEHQFQISCGPLGGKQLAKCFQPSQDEQVSLDDFFPTTIIVSHSIKDPIEMLGGLALCCISAFMGIEGKGKAFRKAADKYYFEAPFTSYNPSDYLKEILGIVYKNLIKDVGEFPGKPVIIPPKGKKEGKKSSLTLFCPSCHYELKVKRSTFEKYGEKCPTCPCGTRMGVDLSDEEEAEAKEEQ